MTSITTSRQAFLPLLASVLIFAAHLGAAALALSGAEPADEGRLRVGWAKVDITPDGPVAMRRGAVSKGVMDPVSYGLGNAVAAHHHVASYLDGSSRMAGSLQGGKISDPDFTHLEGFEDHSVHLLYLWDAEGRLSGVVANVACPAQVQRGDLLSADYWHEAREELARRLGPEVHLLPQWSAAGDLANLVMAERAGEARMQRLMFPGEEDTRKLRRLQIASRVADAVESVLPFMEDVAETHPPLSHRQLELALPRGFPDPDPAAPPFPAVVHALRIGEVAMVTNPFELYLDYGVRIKGRSPAVQTFVVQIAGGGSYLPTRRAVAGGGYGAIDATCVAGPEAGDRLVEASLGLLEALWGTPSAP